MLDPYPYPRALTDAKSVQQYTNVLTDIRGALDDLGKAVAELPTPSKEHNDVVGLDKWDLEELERFCVMLGDAFEIINDTVGGL